MAAIELLIKVPEEYYKAIKKIPKYQYTTDMLIIANGTPLTEIFEGIKAEIEGLKHEHTDVSGYRWWDNAIDNALSIISHHIGEGSDKE